MKKYIYIAFALVTLFVSCTKENEIIVNDGIEKEAVKIDNPNIPQTIKASIDELTTKTSYDGSGKFTWTSDDQIAVYYSMTDSDSKVHQGWLAYQVSELTDENKTATFSLVAGQDSKTTLFTDDNYEPTGFAVYPVSVARPFASSSNLQEQTSYSGGIPFVTLGSSASTTLANINLTGVKLSDGSFKFSTASSVLKVTLNHIHQNATRVELITNDKENAPISGDFHLSQTNGVYAYTFGTDGTYEPYWRDDFSNSLSTSISPSSDDETIIVYFNVPSGSYEANKLAIRVTEQSGEVTRVLTKHIKKPVKTNVNELLTLPTIDMSYPYTVSITGAANSPQLTFTTNYLRFCVLNTSTNDVSKYNNGMKFTDAKSNVSWALTGAKYNNSGTATVSLTTSGKYYLHYALRNTSGDTGTFSSLDNNDIVEYGTIPFYFLAAADIDKYIGSYTMTYTSSGNNLNTTLTLATSDNAVKGNIKLTEFAGNNGTLYGAYQSSASSMNLVFTNSYNIAFATNRYLYSSGNNLNMHLGFNGSSSANYDNTSWDLICWNLNLTDELVGGDTTQYQYCRGNRN